jgi:small conductance mechanosensitive channel
MLKSRVAAIPNVMKEPAPDVEVYFDTNLAIRQSFGEAGFPAPEQHVAMRGMSAGQSA